ncbi:hypothetical protein [Planktosalinus lacus]|uniref:Uncharacterized protein n=1 Tax=Planktosalinus lacus TaxID=1526573 RepID=A0A8J2V905_9FLAO|nr:hypothetical protein [Planktosalinus lacus]GGD84629.1 hypothetical protein GCM10011312_05820 [Planktosalinus lacus]
MKIHLQSHTHLALFFFLLAALLGAILRLFAVADIPATYRFLVHTHSHIALLGWVYIGLTTLLYKLFLEKAKVAVAYRRIFWFTQVTLAGMLLSFPFQGYALFSILFSTLFLIASYLFAGLFLKKTPAEFRTRLSFKLARWAVLYMVFSSIGPWALGAIMNTLGSTSVWYKMAIYFYLHFQYNGWFVVALLAVLVFLLEQGDFTLHPKKQGKFLRLLNSSVLLTFFLSTLFTEPHWTLYVLGALGAILQTIVFIWLFLWLYPRWKPFSKRLLPGVGPLLIGAGVLLAIKSDMQLLSAIPYFAMLAYYTPDFVIGYLHLVFLGVVSIAQFAFLKQTALLQLSRKAMLLYLAVFVVTELIIFYKGFSLWLDFPLFENYYLILSIASCLFPLALIIIFINTVFQANKKTIL